MAERHGGVYTGHTGKRIKRRGTGAEEGCLGSGSASASALLGCTGARVHSRHLKMKAVVGSRVQRRSPRQMQCLTRYLSSLRRLFKPLNGSQGSKACLSPL
jgi:hypothetical protein